MSTTFSATLHLTMKVAGENYYMLLLGNGVGNVVLAHVMKHDDGMWYCMQDPVWSDPYDNPYAAVECFLRKTGAK